MLTPDRAVQAPAADDAACGFSQAFGRRREIMSALHEPAPTGDAKARSGQEFEARVVATFKRLVGEGLADLPLPAGGQTLARWRVLADVASCDLSLAKLFEGHTDARALFAEMGDAGPGAGSTLATWAAEPPDAKVLFTPDGPEDWPSAGRQVRLTGRKAWCSGADHVSHGLLTVWPAPGNSAMQDHAGTGMPADGPWLACVDMRQAGVHVSRRDWHAVGMEASASLLVEFNGVAACLVGGAGDYLARPGFWQGGAGIAACWWGGARSLAASLYAASASGDDPFRLAALGKVDLALRQTGSLLREAAAWIDAHPRAHAGELAARVRLSAEASARLVLDEAGRALGAGPFCRDAAFARMAADLPVFVRQSHAERDFVVLGRQLVARQSGIAGDSVWVL